jgi:beta-glucosidase-like glycosyl hydrolase
MMKGAEPLGHSGERAVAAFNAGHDILLFGQDWEEAIAAYDYFVDAVKEGKITPQRLELSLGRISGTKFKLDSFILR